MGKSDKKSLGKVKAAQLKAAVKKPCDRCDKQAINSPIASLLQKLGTGCDHKMMVVRIEKPLETPKRVLEKTKVESSPFITRLVQILTGKNLASG